MDDDAWPLAVRRTKSTVRQLNIRFDCAPETGRLKSTSAERQSDAVHEQKGQSIVIEQHHSDTESDSGSDTADNDPLGMAQKADIYRQTDRLYRFAVGQDRSGT